MSSSPIPAPVAHRLFEQYPLQGQVDLSTGPAQAPFHIYDGYGLLLGGTADLDAARSLTLSEQVTPVVTIDGRALVAVWLIDATDASLGAHSELQVSLFVARRPVPPVTPNSLEVLNLLLLRKDVHMLCCGLWNNTPEVVAYNREHLGLPALLARSEFEYDGAGDMTTFSFWEGDHVLCRGRVRPHQSAPWTMVWPMLQALGVSGIWQAMTQPWAASTVMNPSGSVFPANLVAQTFAASDRLVTRLYDVQTDAFAIVPQPYHALAFRPQFVESMHALKFVYLDPQDQALERNLTR